MKFSQIPSQINISTQSKVSAPQLSALRQSTMKQHSQLITNQVDKLKQSHKKITQILSQVQKNKVQCQTTITNLNNQIKDLDSKISTNQKNGNTSQAQDKYRNNIKNLNQEYLNVCKERVRLANQINIKNLKKVDIQDKKSPAHEVFKWVMAGIYNQPTNKYFWPNFKDQAFENDKGHDFVERLGKVSAASVKQQQKIKTQQFLQSYPTISAAPELVNVQGDIDKIKQVAQNFKKGYTISAQVKNNEAAIQKHKQGTMQKQQQMMRWKARSQALKDRIHINQQYLQALNNIQTKLTPKVDVYNSHIEGGQKLQKDFHSLQTWNPSINLTEQKGNCDCGDSNCSIF